VEVRILSGPLLFPPVMAECLFLGEFQATFLTVRFDSGDL